MLPGKVHALSVANGQGYCVTYDTGHSRRTLNVPAQPPCEEARPIAAESFALHPDAYHAMLQRVEALAKKDI